MLKHHVEYYDKDKTKIFFECWKLNEEFHREDGPACIFYFEDGSIATKEYYINGKLYREDGPAHIVYNKDGSVDFEVYYLNGEGYILEEEWFERLSARQKVDYLLKG